MPSHIADQSIRALRADRPGGPEVLHVRDVPAPVAGAGEVLVRTTATSINPVDARMRANTRLTFPLTLGWDLAGVVVESNTLAFQPGDRVMGLADLHKTGTAAWADLVAVDAHALAPAPASAALTEAATLPLAGLTALQCWSRPPLPASPHVLVIGAAGAIGGYIVQIAVGSRRHPARVDALVSRTAHVPVAKSLGASLVTTDAAALPEHVYDVVFDTVGLATNGFPVSRLLRTGGHYVAPNGNLPDIPNAHSVMVSPDAKKLDQLARLTDDGTLRLRVSAHYPIREVQEAHRRFEAGGLTGKVVLVF